MSSNQVGKNVWSPEWRFHKKTHPERKYMPNTISITHSEYRCTPGITTPDFFADDKARVAMHSGSRFISNASCIAGEDLLEKDSARYGMSPRINIISDIRNRGPSKDKDEGSTSTNDNKISTVEQIRDHHEVNEDGQSQESSTNQTDEDWKGTMEKLLLLKIFLIDVVFKIIDLGTDVWKVSGYIEQTNALPYCLFALSVKWLPAVLVFLHVQEKSRQREKVCPGVEPADLSRRGRENNYGFFPRLTNNWGWTQLATGALVALIFFPFVSILLCARFLLAFCGGGDAANGGEAFWREFGALNEICIITNLVEAPVQIVATLWLLFRDIININKDPAPAITWHEDKFGNPMPLPSLQVASIVTSGVSLLSSTIAVARPTSCQNGWKTFVAKFAEASVVSCCAVILRLTMHGLLWLFLDIKAAATIVLGVLHNLAIAGFLIDGKQRGKHVARNDNVNFWMTVWFGMIFPCTCLFTRETQDDDHFKAKHLHIQNIICTTVLSAALLLVMILVNHTDFKYNDNIFSNQSFNTLATLLLVYSSALVCYSLFSMLIGKMARNKSIARGVTILAVIFLSTLPITLTVFFMLENLSQDIFILVQTQNGNKVTLRECSGEVLRTGWNENHVLFHQLTPCPTHQQANFQAVQMSCVLLDLADPYCHRLAQNQAEKVWQLLDIWESATVLSVRKDQSHYFRVAADGQAIAWNRRQQLTRRLPSVLNHMSVQCQSYTCVHANNRRTSENEVFLSEAGNPSIGIHLKVVKPRTNDEVYTAGTEQLVEVTAEDLPCSDWSKRSLSLSDLFCDLDNRWEDWLLRSYHCCTPVTNNAVLTNCQGQRNASWVQPVWGSWSALSMCQLSFTEGGAIRSVRRRLRLARLTEEQTSHGHLANNTVTTETCVLVEKEVLDCDTGQTVGGCNHKKISMFVGKCHD